jgi:hypothetical protein
MENIDSRIIRNNLDLKLYKIWSWNMLDLISISIGLFLVFFLSALFFVEDNFFFSKWPILLLVHKMLQYFTNKTPSIPDVKVDICYLELSS